MKKRNFLPIGFATLLSAMGCGGQDLSHENSNLMALTGTSTIKESIYLRSCDNNLDCEADELSFHYGSASETKPFEAIYRSSGYISFQANKIFWKQESHQIEIGRSTKNGAIICSQNYDDICDINFTIKYPNEDDDSYAEPVYLVDFYLVEFTERSSYGMSSGSHTNLLKYVIPSPNQEAAGSCHYMAATGAMEILWNQSKHRKGQWFDNRINGSSDISEAYLMNIPYANRDSITGLRKIVGFNNASSQAVLNRDFPFWNSENSKHDATRNWSRRVAKRSSVAVPKANISNIYGGISITDGTKWDVGVLNSRHVERVKEELRKDRPVLVTYNHFGYWHVVVVVGYNDHVEKDCGWVKQFMNRTASSSQFRTYQSKVRRSLYEGGGCRGKGVFYVRDSLGFGGGGDRAIKYTQRSYDWLEHLGNHIYSVY
ncbi:MAG: hypothetical protein ACOH5I_08715 [Oligoflexus sp.]